MLFIQSVQGTPEMFLYYRISINKAVKYGRKSNQYSTALYMYAFPFLPIRSTTSMWKRMFRTTFARLAGIFTCLAKSLQVNSSGNVSGKNCM